MDTFRELKWAPSLPSGNHWPLLGRSWRLLGRSWPALGVLSRASLAVVWSLLASSGSLWSPFGRPEVAGSDSGTIADQFWKFKASKTNCAVCKNHGCRALSAPPPEESHRLPIETQEAPQDGLQEARGLLYPHGQCGPRRRLKRARRQRQGQQQKTKRARGPRGPKRAPRGPQEGPKKA